MLARSRKRSASDWAGCLCCILLVGLTVYKAPRASVALVLLVFPDFLRAAAFLIRGEKFTRLPGLGPKLASYAGGFAALLLFDLFGYIRPEWVARNDGSIATLGTLLIFSALLVVPWAVWQLRHSFSIEPQARELVTSGPYGISRHPLYVLHIVQTIGLWMSHRTLAVAAIVLVSGTLQGVRMYYEERVLNNAFPEYAEYRQQVDLLGVRTLSRVMRALLSPGNNPIAIHTK